MDITTVDIDDIDFEELAFAGVSPEEARRCYKQARKDMWSEGIGREIQVDDYCQ